MKNMAQLTVVFYGLGWNLRRVDCEVVTFLHNQLFFEEKKRKKKKKKSFFFFEINNGGVLDLCNKSIHNLKYGS